jgi:DNA-binding NtrC family response regulator
VEVAASSAATNGESGSEIVSLPVGTTMDDAEKEMIRYTLSHTNGNKTRAAKMLGISLKTMHNKVKKFAL